MQDRRWIVFISVVFLAAVVLRYLLPTQYGVSFRSAGVIRGLPLNHLLFWLILVGLAITVVVKTVTVFRVFLR